MPVSEPHIMRLKTPAKELALCAQDHAAVGKRTDDASQFFDTLINRIYLDARGDGKCFDTKDSMSQIKLNSFRIQHPRGHEVVRAFTYIIWHGVSGSMFLQFECFWFWKVLAFSVFVVFCVLVVFIVFFFAFGAFEVLGLVWCFCCLCLLLLFFIIFLLLGFWVLSVLFAFWLFFLCFQFFCLGNFWDFLWIWCFFVFVVLKIWVFWDWFH